VLGLATIIFEHFVNKIKEEKKGQKVGLKKIKFGAAKFWKD
jgi:hypothetical protein